MPTKRELQKLLTRWQAALRLSDWDIELKVLPRGRIHGNDGECYAYPDLREAEIRIVSGATSSKFADHETVLVHELLHCHMDRAQTDENEEAIEAAVEVLSKCIVALARRCRAPR